MQKRLALARPTKNITRSAIFFDLRHMSTHLFPTTNLPSIFLWQTPTLPIPTIPLKPTARVMFVVNPTSGAPNRKRLASAHFKII
jgi:hypothetical protein